MVNYLHKFAPNISTIAAPLRDLIKDNTSFIWESQQDQCLSRMKDMIATAPVLRYFDPAKEVVLQCDASERGLGAAISKMGSHWHLRQGH